MGQRSQWDTRFSRFFTKKSHSHSHVKKRPLSIKYPALMPIFCQKKVCSLKNTMLSCHCFSTFSLKTHCCHSPDWSKTRKFRQHYFILWTKKVNWMPFFHNFSRKIDALWTIFCQKTSIFKKTRRSHAQILSKKRPFF